MDHRVRPDSPPETASDAKNRCRSVCQQQQLRRRGRMKRAGKTRKGTCSASRQQLRRVLCFRVFRSRSGPVQAPTQRRRGSALTFARARRNGSDLARPYPCTHIASVSIHARTHTHTHTHTAADAETRSNGKCRTKWSRASLLGIRTYHMAEEKIRDAMEPPNEAQPGYTDML